MLLQQAHSLVTRVVVELSTYGISLHNEGNLKSKMPTIGFVVEH
jgi:hypothetical protein